MLDVGRTVYSLPIPLDLTIKHRVFVLWQHLFLSRHLQFPPFNLLHALTLSCKRIIEGRDYRVDVPEAFTLAILLMSREAPWDLPVSRSVTVLSNIDFLYEALLGGERAQLRNHEDTYHSRPPDNGFVRRKGPNIVDVCVCDAGRRVLHDAMF
jgi:hypothetical protein